MIGKAADHETKGLNTEQFLRIVPQKCMNCELNWRHAGKMFTIISGRTLHR